MTTRHNITVTALNGKYYLDGVEAPTLDIISGHTYIFDLSDASLSTHPFRLKLNNNEWGDNVVLTNSTLTLEVPSTSLGTLSYFCANHVGMGNDFKIIPNNIAGTDQSENITGLSGTDWISASNGNDILDGAAGDNDVVFYEPYSHDGTLIINYTNVLQGENQEFSALTAYKDNNTIDKLDGFEAIHGSYTDDVFYLDSSLIDYVFLRDGDDVAYIYGDQKLSVRMGSGDDIIWGNGATRISFQDDGNGQKIQQTGVNVELSLQGEGIASDGFGNTDKFSGIERIYGSDFNDTFLGSDSDDIIYGNSGNDIIYTGGANDRDRIYGDEGDDTIIKTGNGSLSVYGGAGNDIIDLQGLGIGSYANVRPNIGANTIIGPETKWNANDDGAELYYDDVEGSGGIVATFSSPGTGTVTSRNAGFINDNFTFVSRIRGTSDDDHFIGSDNERWEGWEGFAGNDLIEAGGGFDELLYHQSYQGGGSGAATVNFATGTALDPFGDTDNFSGIEAVRGTSKNYCLFETIPACIRPNCQVRI